MKILKKITHKYLVACLIVIALVAVAYLLSNGLHHSRLPSSKDSEITQLQKLNTDDSKRVQVVHFEQLKEYEKAYKVALIVAEKSKSKEDYNELLSLCAQHEFTDRKMCFKKTYQYYFDRTSDLRFDEAYVAGVDFEKNGFKHESKLFYERAYDTYQSGYDTDAVILTKDQLRKHIDEL